MSAQSSPASAGAVIAPSHDDLVAICGEVWESYLGAGEDDPLLTAPPGSDAEPPPELVAATVGVTGAWTGFVVVLADDQAAREMSATLLMLDSPDEATEDDVSDALGEIANVIGGNVKSLLPGPSELSLPQVARGRLRLDFPGAVEASRVDLLWHTRGVSVVVWAGPTSA